MGFGSTQEGGPTSEQLLMTRVTVGDADACNATYADMLGAPGQQICAGGWGGLPFRRRGFWVWLAFLSALFV
jgi:hypothetical protein